MNLGRTNLPPAVSATTRVSPAGRWLVPWKDWSPEHRSWVWMTVSALLFSLVPAFFVLGDAKESPLTFVATVKIFQFILVVVFAIGVGTLLRVRSTLFAVSRRAPFLLALGVLGAFAYLFFAAAIGLVGPLIATLLYEMWPVVAILVVVVVPYFSPLQRKGAKDVTLWLGFGLCLIGPVVFSLGQSKDPEVVRIILPYEITVPGYFGMLVAAFALLLAVLFFLCTRQLSEVLSDEFKGTSNSPNKETCVSIAYAMPLMVTTPIYLGLAFGWGQWISLASTFWAMCGAVGIAGGALALRMANDENENYNVNVVYYIALIVSLGWLVLVGQVEPEALKKLPILEYILIGCAAILIGNLVSVFRLEQGIAFNGLLVSLCLFGLWVFWYPAPSYNLYYEAVIAVVTVFVLLLSFRTNRLVRRIQRDQADATWLWRAIKTIGNPKHEEMAYQHLNALVTSRHSPELKDAYAELQGSSHLMAGEHGDIARYRIDALVNSRNQEAGLGELVATGILGVLAIGGLLLFQPKYNFDPAPLSIRRIDLFADLSAILLSSSIVFLFLCLLDLQRSRHQSPIDLQSGGLKGLQVKETWPGIVVALVASAGILVLYGFALWIRGGG